VLDLEICLEQSSAEYVEMRTYPREALSASVKDWKIERLSSGKYENMPDYLSTKAEISHPQIFLMSLITLFIKFS